MSVLFLCFIIYSVCRLIKKPDKIESIIFHIILTSKTILKVNFFGNVKIHFESSDQQGPHNRHIYILNSQESVYIYIYMPNWKTMKYLLLKSHYC
jgi:hypothetical protein